MLLVPHSRGAEDSELSLNIRLQKMSTYTGNYEGWNFNSGNYLFTTDTK